MSHPLIVEAIEDNFVPVLVYNNKKSDESILKKFKEPSWNNPVFRFLDKNGQDIIARKANIWTTRGVADRIAKSLKQLGKPVPTYLELIDESPARPQSAEFAMHCYWEGEAHLGSIPGVISTRSGWRDRLEVVQLTYDPAVVDYARLVDEAKRFKCASKIFTHTDKQQAIASKKVGNQAVRVDSDMRDAKDSDQKYYLLQTRFRHLPLTELQATKINGAIGKKFLAKERPGRELMQLLSPRQQQWLRQMSAVQESSPGTFKGLMYPRDPNQLASYTKTFLSKLGNTK